MSLLCHCFVDGFFCLSSETCSRISYTGLGKRIFDENLSICNNYIVLSCVTEKTHFCGFLGKTSIKIIRLEKFVLCFRFLTNRTVCLCIWICFISGLFVSVPSVVVFYYLQMWSKATFLPSNHLTNSPWVYDLQKYISLKN